MHTALSAADEYDDCPEQRFKNIDTSKLVSLRFFICPITHKKIIIDECSEPT